MKNKKNNLTRRNFVKASLLAASGTALGMDSGISIPFFGKKQKPNFVYIICDQLSLDSISGYGCKFVNTPNIDRLIKAGTSFIESHSTSAVCSPARSSLLTGKMPAETGVISNDRAINSAIPNTGQWFRKAGYETVYCGKWHLPYGYQSKIEGFDVLPVGSAQGDLVDPVVSRNCEAYLMNRKKDKPFVLVSSLMQPHDICYWAIYQNRLVPKNRIFKTLEDKFPQLAYNHDKIPVEPKVLKGSRYAGFTTEQWEYYAYIYYRQIEMLDADVGRILNAIEYSGQKDNTVIIFTSDHGEGLGRHKMVQKWHPYEESVKVPLVFSCPGMIKQNHIDRTHLVSGIDVMPTMCDLAEITPPPNDTGMSLKHFTKNKEVPWRDFVVADTNFGGQMLRTKQYKYARYPDDTTEMLFDMQADPSETKNLYSESRYKDTISRHRKLLDDWNKTLRAVTPSPVDIPF